MDPARVRGDVRFLPAPLKDRLLRLADRPHSILPVQVYGEASKPSILFQYYLIDTNEFQSNIFTSVVPGINDTAIPTAANEANCKLHTVGAVRLVLEPKPGLPTDPNDPRAFSGIFSDVSGLFVINNESGWYEGWMIHDITVPEVAYKVGYDPDSYVAFFGKVLEEERRSAGSVPKVFLDHPPTPERILKSQEEIKEVLPKRDQYLVSTSEFADVRARLSTAVSTLQKQQKPSPTLQTREAASGNTRTRTDGEGKDRGVRQPSRAPSARLGWQWGARRAQ